MLGTRVLGRRVLDARVLGAVLASAGLLGVGLGSASCGGEGSGKDPLQREELYYPTGLAVSPGGGALYVVNSDFDLQFNGGTLESYDLFKIRRDAAAQVVTPPPGCPNDPPVLDDNGKRVPLGQTCAPPTRAIEYQKDKVVIGAFTTELALSRYSGLDQGSGKRIHRLYALVRGDTSLTYADVESDADASGQPILNGADPFTLSCGQGPDRRCGEDHHAGRDINEPGNTRDLALPGEPFSFAESQDGSFLVVSHQGDTKASLFFTGFSGPTAPDGTTVPNSEESTFVRPALKHVLDGLPLGGTGVATVPQDTRAFPECAPAPPGAAPPTCVPTPAFFLGNRPTGGNRTQGTLTLLRAYRDVTVGTSVEVSRPFLAREREVTINVTSAVADARGMIIDPSPRIECEKRLRYENEIAPAPKTEAELAPALALCARRPARLFIANRAPASLIVGEVGDAALGSDGTYDPTRVLLQATIPLAAGPSRVYLAPIVDAAGLYALRVFVVCFDARTIFVFDPATNNLENIIRTPEGPHALTFDPFDLADIIDKRVRGIPVPVDARSCCDATPGPNGECCEPGSSSGGGACKVRGAYDPATCFFPPETYPRKTSADDADPSRWNPADLVMRRYRFAYLASFTRSYIQVVDLDNSRPSKATFETVVFSLGTPSKPVGSK